MYSIAGALWPGILSKQAQYGTLDPEVTVLKVGTLTGFDPRKDGEGSKRRQNRDELDRFNASFGRRLDNGLAAFHLADLIENSRKY
jgi:hypothetical protein